MEEAELLKERLQAITVRQTYTGYIWIFRFDYSIYLHNDILYKWLCVLFLSLILQNHLFVKWMCNDEYDNVQSGSHYHNTKLRWTEH